MGGDKTAPAIVKIPPPVWALVMLVAAYGLQRSFAWAEKTYVQSTIAAIVLAVVGIALAVWAERMFAAVGTEILPASPANKALVATGPFRFTRNPMYVGFLLIVTGFALYFGTIPFFAVPVLLFLLIHFIFIPFEETKMLRQFDGPYAEYCARVRRWL